jgi:hypothetical protein
MLADATLAVVDANVSVDDHAAFIGRTSPGYRSPTPPDVRQFGAWRTHGTKVAGLACADSPYVTGVAPEARILPVSVPALGSAAATADALRWAADNGADVLCCAWTSDLSNEAGGSRTETHAALDYCLTHGRLGKGCVVVFASGNDGHKIGHNAYASHAGVITVGACNCHAKHPVYSNWGEALWCVFPANDPDVPGGASMSYKTTAPVGSLLLGESFYSSAFGFTSAASAIVAGICALIVSANPDLTSSDVRGVLRAACEPIDIENGTYDARGHSPFYGFGRPDIGQAVRLAQRYVEKTPSMSV